MNTLTGLLSSLIIFLGITIAFFLFLTGQWESISPFDKISGPMRMKQLVIDPTPQGMTDIRGGSIGFPSDIIITTFNINREFHPAYLGEWVFYANIRKLRRYSQDPAVTTILDAINDHYAFVDEDKVEIFLPKDAATLNTAIVINWPASSGFLIKK